MGDFEGKFQPNLQAKTINFFIWKFRFILLIFLLFFTEFVKFSAFYTLLQIRIFGGFAQIHRVLQEYSSSFGIPWKQMTVLTDVFDIQLLYSCNALQK